MVCCLFSRPDSDTALCYLFFYSKELVKLSQDLGYLTLNKEKNEANQNNIFSLIEAKKPNFIMFNGHGSPDEIFGHDDELIINSENAEVLRNSITYSLSCSSAQILGPESITKGTKCFIGYDTEFALGKDPDSEASPRHDKIAKLFLEPSNLLVSSLLRGSNVQQAVEKAKSKMLENVWLLNTTNSFPEAIHYAPFLFGNYLGLIAHGNQEESIKN